jgi:uncharacterized protein
MMFDPFYLLFAAPGMVLALLAMLLTKARFAHYSQVQAASGLTGTQAAHQLLSRQGIQDVTIEEVDGFLSDHYDPTSRTLRLSPGVYRSSSLAAVGVACHEAGHAIQHATAYTWLGLRSALVPVTNIGSMLAPLIFGLGFLMSSPTMVYAAIALFTGVVAFALITLPVEWDASARAKRLMVTSGIVSSHEQVDAAKVLNAAFLTYVSSAVGAILTLLYYLWRAGLLGGNRRDD